MTSRLAILCVSVSLCLCGSFPSAYAADKWVAIHTKNFTLIGNASESDIRRTGRTLEEFRSAMALVFPKVDQVSAAPTTIFVFRSDESFKPYKPIYKGQPANVLAYFQPGEDVNYIALTAGLPSPNVILHEYVHFLLREHVGSLPLWIREGLAECYSTFDLNGRQNEFTLGRAPEQHIATLNMTPQFIPLKKLFDVRDNSPEYNEESKQGMFYAESWAITHYFLFGSDSRRRMQFVDFVTALARGNPPDTSFSEAFKTDYGTIETEVGEYVRKRSSWQTMKVTSKEPIQTDARNTVATLSDAETEYYLGDLLLHLNRLQDAEMHLTAAMAKARDLAPVQASMALLRVRQKKYDEALRLLKTTAEGDSKNPMIAFYYAYVLERADAENAFANVSEDRTETIRTYAKKSIELAPRFVEAYGLLARVDLNSGQHLDEVEDTLKKALAIAPGREDFQIWLAQAYLRTKRTPEAHSVLESVERNTANSDTRRRATALLNQGEQSLGLAEITQSIESELLRKERAPDEVQSITLAGLAPPPSRKAEDTVVESLTPVAPALQGEKLSGLLINLDCGNGLTLRVRTGNNTVELHSSNPDKIQFLSYSADVGNNVQCGPRNPGVPVNVTYRPVPGGQGDPLVIEFPDKK
jgi:tetratricopeptide (TPR) repeat protein